VAARGSSHGPRQPREAQSQTTPAPAPARGRRGRWRCSGRASLPRPIELRSPHRATRRPRRGWLQRRHGPIRGHGRPSRHLVAGGRETCHVTGQFAVPDRRHRRPTRDGLPQERLHRLGVEGTRRQGRESRPQPPELAAGSRAASARCDRSRSPISTTSAQPGRGSAGRSPVTRISTAISYPPLLSFAGPLGVALGTSESPQAQRDEDEGHPQQRPQVRHELADRTPRRSATAGPRPGRRWPVEMRDMSCIQPGRTVGRVVDAADEQQARL